MRQPPQTLPTTCSLALAMIRPVPEKRGRGNKSGINADFPEISRGKVSQARTVLKQESPAAHGSLSFIE